MNDHTDADITAHMQNFTFCEWQCLCMYYGPSEERVQITEDTSVSLCLVCDVAGCKVCTGNKAQCVTCKDGYIANGNTVCDGQLIFFPSDRLSSIYGIRCINISKAVKSRY